MTAEVDPGRGASVGAMDDAKTKAEAIRARVAKGESFDKLAAEVSDSPSKANGGLIGPISRDEMNEELLKMLSKMKVGDITPVVNMPTGCPIFKLESSIDSTTLPFEAARDPDRDKLGQREDRRRAQEVHSEPAVAGADRVEERRYPEGVGNRYCREPTSDAESNWFAIWTRSRHEQVVRDQLSAKQFDAFLPNHHPWSRWKDRKKRSTGRCFPAIALPGSIPPSRLPS